MVTNTDTEAARGSTQKQQILTAASKLTSCNVASIDGCRKHIVGAQLIPCVERCQTRVPRQLKIHCVCPAYLDCVQDNVGQSVAWNEPLSSQLGRGLSWARLLASTTELLCHCLHASSAAAAAAALAFSCAGCCALCFLGCTSTYERKDGRHSGQRSAEIWQKQTKISAGAHVTVTQSRQYATSSCVPHLYIRKPNSLSCVDASLVGVVCSLMTDRSKR